MNKKVLFNTILVITAITSAVYTVAGYYSTDEIKITMKAPEAPNVVENVQSDKIPPKARVVDIPSAPNLGDQERVKPHKEAEISDFNLGYYNKKTVAITFFEIHLSKPSQVQLQTFKDSIKIEGAIVTNDKKLLTRLIKKDGIQLLPVIEGSSYYTYDSIPVRRDGAFKYSWPVSPEHINGRMFWVGVFEMEGKTQPRNRYNTSPITSAKYASEFIYFE